MTRKGLTILLNALVYLERQKMITQLSPSDNQSHRDVYYYFEGIQAVRDIIIAEVADNG